MQKNTKRPADKKAPAKAPIKSKASKPLDLDDILPCIRGIVGARSNKRYRLGIRGKVLDCEVYSGNPSNVIAHFGGRTSGRDPFYIIHNGLMNTLIREYNKPMKKLEEFMKKYG